MRQSFWLGAEQRASSSAVPWVWDWRWLEGAANRTALLFQYWKIPTSTHSRSKTSLLIFVTGNVCAFAFFVLHFPVPGFEPMTLDLSELFLIIFPLTELNMKTKLHLMSLFCCYFKINFLKHLRHFKLVQFLPYQIKVGFEPTTWETNRRPFSWLV